MTIHFLYDLAGTDLGDTITRLGWGEGLSMQAANGAASFSSIPFDDPTGTLNITGLTPFRVIEDACSVPTIWNGYIYDRDIARAPDASLILGAANRLGTGLVDLNNVLNIRVIRGLAAKRPAETVSARLTWLFSSPWVSYGKTSQSSLDNGEVASGVTTMLSAADYRGQFGYNVIADCAEIVGYNFFIYWKEPANLISLYFRPPSYSGYASTLRFTNDLAEVIASPTDTFFATATLKRTAENVYSGVYVVYSGGSALVSRPSIVSEFFIRQTTMEKPNITTRAHALAWGSRFLDDHDAEQDTITLTAQVPKASVNLIRAGHLVNIKFSHLDGYENWTGIRASLRTVAQSDETDEYYTITLELSDVKPTSGLGAAGSPDNGRVWPTNLIPFSGQCGSDAPYVQSVYADASGSTSSTWTYGATPTAGNLLLALYQRATSNPDTHYNHETPTDAGWLDTGVYGSYLIDPTVNRIGGMRLWYKVAGAAETGITLTDPIDGGNIGGGLILAEYGTVGSAPVVNVAESAIQYATVNGVLPTVAANAPALLISMLGASLGATHTPPTGYTERVTHISGDPWTLALSDRFVSAAGTYGGENYVGPGIGPATWLLPLLAFEVDCNSPSTGQPIRNEQGRPGSPTAHPYAALSLDVHVDGVLQIVTETDPTTGAYDIGWVPGPTATVRRDYLSE